MSERELAEEIGMNLARLLEENEMNQTQLSILTGIDKSTISKYIKGLALPTTKNLVNIVYALDCYFDDLVPSDEQIY